MLLIRSPRSLRKVAEETHPEKYGNWACECMVRIFLGCASLTAVIIVATALLRQPWRVFDPFMSDTDIYSILLSG
jgi:hypothetical protein